MQGYIILNENKNSLIKDFYKDGSNFMVWYPKNKFTDCHVYTEEELKHIIKKSFEQNWSGKPTFVIPAKYENGKVKLLGRRKKINPLIIMDEPLNLNVTLYEKAKKLFYERLRSNAKNSTK